MNWADLFPEILVLIFRRLLISDLFRCSAVCIPWDAAVRHIRSQRLPLLRQTPWLLLLMEEQAESSAAAIARRRHGRGRNNVSAICYSLTEDQIYRLPLQLDPLIQHPTCIGSSADGWLILVDDRHQMILLNPITGAYIDNLPMPLPFFEPRERIMDAPLSQFFYFKAALSSKPSRSSYAVMVITKRSYFLSYARSGDTKWTLAPADRWIDVSFDDSKGVFYAIDMKGRVQVWDLNTPSPVGLPVGCGVTSRYCVLSPSPSGDILQFSVEHMNRRIRPIYVFPCPNSMDGKLFRVYRTNGDETGTDSLPNLKDCSYLIGGNNPICISSADFPEFRPNCIYSVVHQNPLRSIYLYNVEDQSAKEVGPKFTDRFPRMPSWFTPSLN